MAKPGKVNFKMYQGATFRETFRWESSTKGYKTISNITKAAPCVVTAPDHGLPVGWRTRVTNVAGMVEINTPEDVYYTVTDVTEDTVTFNDINSLAFKAYISGGVLEFNKAVDLSTYTARMQIRRKLSDETVVLELNTSNGGIILDAVNSTITIYVTAAQTEQLGFSTGVYSLEMVNGSEVTQLIAGNISLVLEVTR